MSAETFTSISNMDSVKEFSTDKESDTCQQESADTVTDPAPKPTFTNCHTHIFVGANLPPYLAKTFLPWPLYTWLTIPLILNLCRWWYLNPNSPRQWKHHLWHKHLKIIWYSYRSFIFRHGLLSFLVSLINFIISFHALIYVILWAGNLLLRPNSAVSEWLVRAVLWLKSHSVLLLPKNSWTRAAIVLATFLFIKTGRQMLIFLFRKVGRFLSILPDKKTVEFMARYLNIGRFAYYKQQARIFIKLKDQYPLGTRFVLLPMDMEFMGAGAIPAIGTFDIQMKQLAAIKHNKKYKDLVCPFVFADPRRKVVGDQNFLDWESDQPGTMQLKDCFIRDYIEKERFSGFKIYPALGYYPFDEALLPLWKYAADRGIPILTHAIRGTIFYRGTKEKAWGYHPVFRQSDGDRSTRPLLLPQLKNVDFINNFTHPLNYLCLVEEKLLRLLVAKASPAIQNLFGFQNEATPMLYNLSHLKLCFGHFGGDDEWQKFFENDRDNFSSQLMRKPGKGVVCIKEGNIKNSMFTLEQAWKSVDWYTIIRSLMLQYENLYADISYIVHQPSIFPLLKQTLQHPVLQKKVLFGTDFYVVRNHKSEKEILAYLEATLTPQELDLITRHNPKEFLSW